MEFNFDCPENKILISAETSENYFYQVASSCSVIFLDTEGKILMDIEDETVKNLLKNLASKEKPSKQPHIGDSFVVKNKSKKIGNEKLVFFYIDGHFNYKEVRTLFKKLPDDVKKLYHEKVKEFFYDGKKFTHGDGTTMTKKQRQIMAEYFYGGLELPAKKVDRDFIEILVKNTNNSISIQHPTGSPWFKNYESVYENMIIELLHESQQHGIKKVKLCSGGDWRIYTETNVRLKRLAEWYDCYEYDVLTFNDTYFGHAVRVDNLEAELRYKDSLIEKLQTENKESHYPIDYTNHIIESDSEPTLVIIGLNSCLEIVSRYMGQIFLADYIEAGKIDDDLNKGINKILTIGHLTIGTWAKICMMISESYKKENSSPYLLPELAELIPSKDFQDLYGKITKVRNMAAHSFTPNLEGKIDTGDYRENIITFINMIKSALVKTKLIYINEKASLENDGETLETKFQILEGLYPRKNKTKTKQHLKHEQLYITDESNEKYVRLHPFMKYEVSSDSKKTEFYTIKRIIQSTFFYDNISRGEGTKQEIDIDSII